MTNSNTSWTPERIAELKSLHEAGLSASEIADALGGFEHCQDRGRSAVLGKIFRLRNRKVLPESTLHAQQAQNRKLAAERREERKRLREAERARKTVLRYVNRGHHLLLCETLEDQEPAPLQNDMSIPAEQRKSLLELNETTCRYPVGDPQSQDFFFCGATPKSGSPYCPAHHRIAYRPPADRHRDRNNRSDSVRHFREEAA